MVCFHGSKLHCKVLLLGGIHKESPYLGEGKGLATMQQKWIGGGGLALIGCPFQCGLWKREAGILRSFIIVFLC